MSRLAAGTPALTTFYVYLTSGCNCACRHCYFVDNGAGRGSSGQILDPDCLRRAITEALPLGLRRLKWTGGEPTLHPAFATLLRLQRQFGLAASLETNGLLVDRRLAELLGQCGVEQVSVSLDGATAASHDAIRGVEGAFERTLGGIRALVDAGYAPELILTLQRDNVAELDAYLALAGQLGAGAVKLNVLQPFAGGESLLREGHALSIAELVGIAQGLPANLAGMPVRMSVPWAFRPISRLVTGDQDGTCNVLHILGVLPHGEYALCGAGQRLAGLAMGTIMSSSLDEVWSRHPVLQRLRAGLPEQLQGVCGDCLMKGACRGSCVASNVVVGGDLFAPHWFCQQALAAGLFPASRLAKKPQAN